MIESTTSPSKEENGIKEEIEKIQKISKSLPKPVLQGDLIKEWHIPFINVKCQMFQFGIGYLEKFQDIKDSGIYFLFDSETFAGHYKTPNLYIGQAITLGKRLKEHARNPEKFNKYDKAIIFSSEDITDTLLNIIEKQCIEVAVGCRRVLSSNRTIGNASSSDSKDLHNRAIFFCAVIAKLLEAEDRPALTVRKTDPFMAIRSKKPQLIGLCHGDSKLVALELENKGLLVLRGSSFRSFKKKNKRKDPSIDEICISLGFNEYFDEKEEKLRYDYFLSNNSSNSSKELASQIFLGKRLSSSKWKPLQSDLSFNNWDRALVEKFFNDKEEMPSCLEAHPLAQRCYNDIYDELCDNSKIEVGLPGSQSLKKGLSFNMKKESGRIPKDYFRFLVNTDDSVTIKVIRTKARWGVKQDFENLKKLSNDKRFHILKISTLDQWEAIGRDICRYINRSLTLSTNSLEPKLISNIKSEEIQAENLTVDTNCVHLKNLTKAPENIKNLYTRICDYIENLGRDVISAQKKFYLAYRRSQNFVCIEIKTQKVILNLQLDPRKEKIEEGFSRNMINTGHYGTGNYQIVVSDEKTFEKALPYLRKAYERNA